MENNERSLSIQIDECIKRDNRTQATELVESLSKEHFIRASYIKSEYRPSDWRVGQFMYNYYFDKYPEIVNKIVQERPYVDCFYNDNKIDDFLTVVYQERYSKL